MARSIMMSALVLAAVVVQPAGARTSANFPTLDVSYTMNCTFTITGDNGAPVTTIAPGSYQIYVSTPEVFAEVDLSGNLANPNDMTACRSFVQFQLTGPGVNLSTDLQEGDEDYGLLDATFKPSSTYTAVDNNQPTVARVAFSTAASGTPVAPPSVEGSGAGSSKGTASQDIVGSAIKANLKGSLDAIVYKNGKLTLSHNGNAVKNLKTGNWSFSVDDESSKAGFSVQVLNGAPKGLTTAAYVGSKDVTVTLKPGRWSFFSPSGKKTTFFVTS
jgi:hypothetical protein